MSHEPIYYEIPYHHWQTFKSPPLTLRQWFDLLADIFGEEPRTYSIKTLLTKDFADCMESAIIQMELLECLKAQGFEL